MSTSAKCLLYKQLQVTARNSIQLFAVEMNLGFSGHSSCRHLDSKWGALNLSPANCWLCFQPGAQALQLLLSEHSGHFKGCSGQVPAAVSHASSAVPHPSLLLGCMTRPFSVISPTTLNPMGICSTLLSDRAAPLLVAGSEVQLFTCDSVMLMLPHGVTGRYLLVT